MKVAHSEMPLGQRADYPICDLSCLLSLLTFRYAPGGYTSSLALNRVPEGF